GEDGQGGLSRMAAGPTQAEAGGERVDAPAAREDREAHGLQERRVARSQEGAAARQRRNWWAQKAQHLWWAAQQVAWSWSIHCSGAPRSTERRSDRRGRGAGRSWRIAPVWLRVLLAHSRTSPVGGPSTPWGP